MAGLIIGAIVMGGLIIGVLAWASYYSRRRFANG